MSRKRHKDRVKKADIDWGSRKLNFSFGFYEETHKEYTLQSWSKEQILMTILRFKQICSKTLNEMKQGRRTLHFHEVFWESTIEKKGFTNPTANLYHAFQFALLGVSEKGARVYGFLDTGTFYIVWFDLDHKIWPTFPKYT